ncbi:hypothetical protein C8R44DRAFT_922226 [Mycena epipterygia]|nr:hypothetical protein C8R44DRAFT_922226 [Mycena epipterygia]
MHILLLISSFVSLAARVHSEGNISCSGAQLDWYIAVVGETSCKTYERLRQICNVECAHNCVWHWSNKFLIRVSDQVGQMNSSIPPDLCTDQKGSGYDAIYIPGAGFLQDYWNASYDGTHKSHCYAPVYRNFSADIQTAVCNEKIEIFDGLYSDAWSDGSCVNSRDTLNEDNAVKANNTFTTCDRNNLASASINSVLPTGTTSATSLPSSPVPQAKKALGTGIIVGVVMGTTGLIAAALAAYWILRRRRGSRRTGIFITEPYSTSSQSTVSFIPPYFPTGQIPPREK